MSLLARDDFCAVLSEIYDVDLGGGYQQVAVLHRVEASTRLVLDREFRCVVLEALCARLLDDEGLLLLRPGPGFWRPLNEAARFLAGSRDPDVAVAYLFGSIGLAQLCDDSLGSPVPALLQPWRLDQGLLLPRRPPLKAFSQGLTVRRVGSRSLILFDKRCCATSS